MPQVILNQYRHGSAYEDQVGVLYHFPRRYLSRLSKPETEFIYYEPRHGGEQVYFGCGQIGEIWPDDKLEGHYFAEVLEYRPFERLVPLFIERHKTREPAPTMRNSVRAVSDAVFREILASGGIGEIEKFISLNKTSELEAEYREATPERRRWLAVRYERPNAVTKAVKKVRGAQCAICGYTGFLMKNGNRYCEVHHLFHLARRLPGTLSPRFLIVVCANCHRKLHYSRCSDPEEVDGNWSLTVDGARISIPIGGNEISNG